MSKIRPLPFFQRPLILASKSPRRRQLLTEAGFQFTVQTKDVNEDFPASMDAEAVPTFLAEQKAQACREFLFDEAILLSADTVVAKGNRIYNKPTDRADAVRMITELMDGWHRVITGVCLMDHQEKIAFSSVSEVKLERLSDEELAYYVDHFQPYDKAGSYGIQEWIGWCKISEIRGSYANIVGLPIHRVYEALRTF